MSKVIVNTKMLRHQLGSYSQAVKANGMVYVSGQICINPQTGELVNSDIVSETHQVMKNIKAILEEAGSSFEKVVKSGIFVKDLNNFVTINGVYGEYFNADTAPARETVEVSRLPKDVNVEISCIALL